MRPCFYSPVPLPTLPVVKKRRTGGILLFKDGFRSNKVIVRVLKKSIAPCTSAGAASMPGYKLHLSRLLTFLAILTARDLGGKQEGSLKRTL